MLYVINFLNVVNVKLSNPKIIKLFKIIQISTYILSSVPDAISMKQCLNVISQKGYHVIGNYSYILLMQTLLSILFDLQT